MTVQQMRAKDVIKLAERISATPDQEQIDEATHTMNLFYRFAAAYQRSFYTEQSRTASQEEKDEADAKSERAYRRAAEALKNYNLKISLPGLYPIIEETNGVNFTYGHYYG